MRVVEIIERYYGRDNLAIVPNIDNVYRCLKKDDLGVPYQVVYIDLTDAWLSNEFLTHIESVMRNDYFERSGYLQWNFYYYFISPSELISNNKQLRKTVQLDDSYARKEVMTVEEFESFIFAQAAITQRHILDSSEDLYTAWVNRLRDKKLYFVYNEAEYPNYKPHVEGYINGVEFNDVEDTISSGLSQEPSIQKIKFLNLETFRKYPIHDGILELGRVNLIKGFNATGKTSFFSALELIITGDSPTGNSENDYKISFTDSSGHEWNYPTANVYKDRDIKWYKSAMTRGHNLMGNFTKFNYYSSDSAFMLKQNNDQHKNNIEELISNIALGREVNRLEERITEFKNRFEGWKNYYTEQENQLSTSIQEKTYSLEQIRADLKDPTEYRIALLQTLDLYKWKYSNPDESKQFIIGIGTLLQNAENQIRSILEKGVSREKLSKSIIKEEILKLQAKAIQIKTSKDYLINKRNELAEKNKEKLYVTELIEGVAEIRKYFDHKYFKDLIGLDERIRISNTELEKLRINKTSFENIVGLDIITEEYKSRQIADLETEFKEKLARLRDEKKDITNQIEKIEEGLNSLTRIYSQIKSLGGNFIKEDTDTKECPLCESQFLSNSELAQAIQKTTKVFENSNILSTLRDNLRAKENEIESSDSKISVLLNLKQLGSSIFDNGLTNQTINELIDTINNNEKRINRLSDELAQLKVIQTQFVIEGIYEREFIKLKRELEKETKTNITDQHVLSTIQESLVLRFSTATNSLNTIEGKISEVEKQFKLIFDSNFENEEMIAIALAKYEDIENRFQQLLIIFDFSDQAMIQSVSDGVDAVRGAFDLYKKEVDNNSTQRQSIQIIEDELQKVNDELAELIPKKLNATFAFDELRQLMIDQNKTSVITEYLRRNKNEIVNTFILIHSPKEFVDITFDNNQVILNTVDGGMRSLNEISTGQRSALALSIFLSLNKKLEGGPNVILLDDPVAYVDDLNSLSFLDYLRELILKTNKQLFFATANEDIAFLFKKKFEFIGAEEFKIFQFSRSE